MKKIHNWMTTLFALVFIATPAVVGYAFFLPDWTPNPLLNYGYLWLVSIGFVIYVILINYFFIFSKILIYESLVFTIPLAIVFCLILITYPLPLWIRAIIIFIGILSTVPINILVQKFH